MCEEEFIKFIESIGFEYNEQYDIYKYKKYNGVDHLDYPIYIIDLYDDHYKFYNGSGCVTYVLDYLTPLEKEFKKELRSIKLKELLR